MSANPVWNVQVRADLVEEAVTFRLTVGRACTR